MSTRQLSYWTRNLIIVWTMLGLWLGVTAGVVWAATDLFTISWRSTIAYWLAAYGAPLCYLLLVGVYAVVMRTRRR